MRCDYVFNFSFIFHYTSLDPYFDFLSPQLCYSRKTSRHLLPMLWCIIFVMNILLYIIQCHIWAFVKNTRYHVGCRCIPVRLMSNGLFFFVNSSFFYFLCALFSCSLSNSNTGTYYKYVKRITVHFILLHLPLLPHHHHHFFQFTFFCIFIDIS